MKLYSYFRSSSSWRVRIALAWKGLSFEYVPVHLLKDAHRASEYLERNPGGTVPTLALDDGRHIGQSMAILEYLEETHPTPPLLPKDVFLRAKARQLAEIVNSSTQPYQTLAVLKHVQTVLKGDEKAWAAHWIAQGLRGFLGEAVKWAGRFSVGDAPSFADVCLLPQLFGARRFGVDVTEFSPLLEIETHCLALPAFAGAVPERQPDAAAQ
ncbi:MAG: maleylacetoacetate isomerase [Myxococcaceae bacterium]